jgi:hypothetical protein
VLPTVSRTAKNIAVGGGEHFPKVSDEATVQVKPLPWPGGGWFRRPLRTVSRLVHEKNHIDSMRRRSYFRAGQIIPL